MADITNIYKKRYSKIESIQAEEVIYYNLIEVKNDDTIAYGVELISNSCKKQSKLSLENISDSKAWIINMITYLYENAIKPEIALGVISDTINSKFL